MAAIEVYYNSDEQCYIIHRREIVCEYYAFCETARSVTFRY